MTEQQAKQIVEMRMKGVGYKSIGTVVGLSRDIVRNYCKYHKLTGYASALTKNVQMKMDTGEACLYCGGSITKPKTGRPKKFCSEKCRREWWKMHPEALKRNEKAMYELVCGHCGKTFISYGNKNRKYSGTTAITGTYQWAKYVNGTWTNISGATSATLSVSGADIVNIQSYRCTMTYDSKTYVDVITVEDKSDPYVSEMLSIGGFTVKNNLGGVVPYVIVRTNQKEVDPLLGPISETAPSSPSAGDFWYKIDHDNQTVTLMDYAGSAWNECPEEQSLTYTWYMQDKDGNTVEFGKTGKVIYLSAEDIDSLVTLQCDVSK